jgi:transketolase
LKTANIDELKKIAAQIRYDVVKMIGANKKGHFGGSLSCADILTALYFHKMKYDGTNPKWEERDRFFLSKGHAAYTQYAALALKGVFPEEELFHAKTPGSRLQGHPDMHKTPGIEGSTGSLGQGISLAAGCAAGLKMDGSKSKVYVLLGDGELAEGQVWEAAMAAYNFRLSNLVAILDRNGLGSMDVIAKRYDLGDIAAKWRAFGWQTIEIDGHDMKQIVEALDAADGAKGPVVIIAHTVKCKGVPFAENMPSYHNNHMTQEEFDKALSDLECSL